MKKYIIILIAALAAYTATAQNQIVGYQYWFDQNDNNGNPIYVEVTSTINYSGLAEIEADDLTAGYHRLYIRMKDSNNNWSSVIWRDVYISPVQTTNKITTIRYWSDTANAFPSDMHEYILDEPVEHLDINAFAGEGFCGTSAELLGNRVYFQLKDSQGYYSSVIWRDINHTTTGVTSTGEPAPFTISQSGLVLTANVSSALGIQWYFEGEPIAGATSVTYSIPAGQEGEYYAQISNNCGTTQSNTLDYVGVEEMGELGRIALFPNPANSNITISLDKADIYEISIYNTNVSLVSQAQMNGTMHSMNVSDLSTGLYIVKIRNNSGLSSERLLMVE